FTELISWTASASHVEALPMGDQARSSQDGEVREEVDVRGDDRTDGSRCHVGHLRRWFSAEGQAYGFVSCSLGDVLLLPEPQDAGTFHEGQVLRFEVCAEDWGLKALNARPITSQEQERIGERLEQDGLLPSLQVTVLHSQASSTAMQDNGMMHMYQQPYQLGTMQQQQQQQRLQQLQQQQAQQQHQQQHQQQLQHQQQHHPQQQMVQSAVMPYPPMHARLFQVPAQTLTATHGSNPTILLERPPMLGESVQDCARALRSGQWQGQRANALPRRPLSLRVLGMARS
ncbi:unnamed protein product, partial [Effrenium voratum]